MRRLTTLAVAGGLTLALATPARAQLNGSHTLGDYGVQAGSQPGPGFYNIVFYYNYDTDTLKDIDGNTVRPLPGSPTNVDIKAIANFFYFVSKGKVAGANYGAMIALPWVNGSLEAPAFALSEKTDMRFSDILVRPFELGWHLKQADVTTGIQFYLPTGRWERDGYDNVGKGMVTYEPYVGTTLFFDEKRTASFATTAFYEVHGDKKDTNTRVGQIVTLEGGVGKSFLGGGLVFGAAYYAQWKVTDDQIGEFIGPDGIERDVTIDGKHKVWAFGPDVTLPIASRSKLFALVNIRYFWETGASLKTQGDSLVVMATIPIPSMRLR